MPLFHLGPAGDAFAGAFGVTVAAILVGGPLLIRWQRNRHQFLLTSAALAQGVTHFPKGPPFWLISLRQGVLTLTIGIGLLIIGGVACGLTRDLQPPTSAQIASTAPTAQSITSSAAPALPPLTEDRPRNIGPHEPPPPPSPALEEWHRLKSFNSLGLTALAAGFLLTLLGGARCAFAKIEQRHASELSTETTEP